MFEEIIADRSVFVFNNQRGSMVFSTCSWDVTSDLITLYHKWQWSNMLETIFKEHVS